MRIAWFSPLSSDQKVSKFSRAAYATDILLPLIEKVAEVELFHDRCTEHQGRSVQSFLNAYERHRENPFDLFFYHLEDGRHSYFSRIHAALIPGVVWFHDFFLSDYGPEPILNSAWRETVACFKDSRHSWCVHDAKHTPAGPQAFRESGVAGVKVFSSERDHNEYRRISELSIVSPHARSYYLPLPVISENRVEVRNSQSRVIFCGAPRIETRAFALLAAMEQLGSEYNLVWLICPDEEGEARELLLEFPGVQVELIVSARAAQKADEWDKLSKNATIAIHTSFSVFGQLSPFLNISLAAGVPTVVCHFGQGELLPSEIVMKVSTGESCASELREVIREIAGRDSSELCTRIATYGQELFSPMVIAQELLSVFKSSQPLLSSLAARWSEFEQAAHEQLLKEAATLVQSEVTSQLGFSNPFAAEYEELFQFSSSNRPSVVNEGP